jgi:hypothetical protein
MKSFKLVALVILSLTAISEDGRLDRDPNDYKYTSLGIYAFDAKDDSGLEAKFSLSLPGPLYLVAEAKADGVDVDNETYDKFTKAIRIGAHVGIGDVLNSISSGGVSLKLENFLDVFLELGLKATDIDSNINFSDSNTEANVISGIRFGNSNAWEGKIFVDFSKETEVVQQQCPVNLICTAFETSQVTYVLDDETDQKFGFVATYNLNKKSAVTIETSTSKVLDSVIKIGYQINF